MVLKNDFLSVRFDNAGCITELIDLRRNITLAHCAKTLPFLLEYEQNVFSSSFKEFKAGNISDTSATLTWTVTKDIVVTAKINLSEKKLSFRATVSNCSERALCSIEYPIIDGIQKIQSQKDYIAHSFALGVLIKDPIDNFVNEGDGFRYMPYPESFSGSTMQFFSYYSESLTGMLFAAYDSIARQKWLNFYRSENSLRASQIYGYEDIGEQKGIDCDWDFTITLTDGDGWYEAADLYRDWAIGQSWCKKGRLLEQDRSNRCNWLRENVGATTFGINAGYDRTRWISQYRKDIGRPIFHILGPDWAKTEQNFYNSVPGGLEDWFPTRFNQQNISKIKEQGDFFAPFEFDFLVAIDKADADEIENSLQKWPDAPKSIDKYLFNMLCPTCDYTKNLHVQRDRKVVSECGSDAMYYDISANNILKTCMSDAHPHPVGGGTALSVAYREIYLETKRSIGEDVKGYFPLGTEMMNETLIDCIDFYQARAFAQPCSGLETYCFRELTKKGEAEIIPLFHYVYSEYAPVRADGWGKLTCEVGDLIYHTIAKTYLWGGLFEINSEYSPMEEMDGVENLSSEHYYHFEQRGFHYSPAICAYMKKFAALRTGKFNKFLAYGKMLRPISTECRKIHRTYFQYNTNKTDHEYEDAGIIPLDAIMSSRYAFEDHEAIFLANTTDFIERIALPTFLELDKKISVCYDYEDDSSPMMEVDSRCLSSLEMKPHQLCIIVV